MTKMEVQPEGFVIYTDHQLRGKGQRGNVWVAEAGKNVLMSVLLKPSGLMIKDQHYLNLVVGLAAIDALKKYHDLPFQLKWPNDVYLNEKKIAGILIENNVRGSVIDSTVVGMGLNLNQKGFSLNQATSLFMESGKEVEKEQFIDDFLSCLEKWYLLLNANKLSQILKAYHDVLRWKDEIHEYQANNELFHGVIIGIDASGRLVIREEDGPARHFNMKEVSFIS